MACNILIANRGLSALKFIISIKEWLAESPREIRLFGFVTPIDVASKYKYVTMLDKAIYTDNDDVYTNIEQIVSFCVEHKISHVFPGWGYLSESEQFVQALNDVNVVFMGPLHESMRLIGNKISCNNVAAELGVPVLPCTQQLHTIEEIEQSCDTIGYPVMLKAGNSGGGKGIRIVRDKSSCSEMMQEILREVVDPMIYATKYVENASHLEIQILGDGNNAIHLHGRDCSSQRRNQKLVEECPITKDPKIVESIQEYAVRIAKHIKYRGLATVEFIYDQDANDVYILEVNPRIQVEHIVTEQLFGINLIKMLFLVSSGWTLSDIAELRDISYNYDKHIVSVRINSENPYEDFRPTIGTVREIDVTYNRNSWGYFSIANDGVISAQVDSQFGHVLAVGTTRETAIRNMTVLLDGLKIRGTIYNTASFLKNYINDDAFVLNRHSTRHLNNSLNTQLFNTKYDTSSIVALGMVFNAMFYSNEEQQTCLTKLAQGHNYHLRQMNQLQAHTLVYNNCLYPYKCIFGINSTILKQCVIEYDGLLYPFSFKYERDAMTILLKDEFVYTVVHSYHDDVQFEVLINQQKYNFVRKVKDNKIRCSASGKIVECVYRSGDHVNVGDVYVKIECMKMIMSFKAERGGAIQYFVQNGDAVLANQIIGEFHTLHSCETSYLTDLNVLSDFYTIDTINELHTKNTALLIVDEYEKQPAFDISMYPSLFSSCYEPLFPEMSVGSKGVGSKAWLIDKQFVLLANDLTVNNGVFSHLEDEFYFQCLRFARDEVIPFVYFANNSGAEIKINERMKYIVKPHFVDGVLSHLYLDKDDYKDEVNCYKDDYKDEIDCVYREDLCHYEITRIHNPGVVNLDGSAFLVAEMAKARLEIPTITFVISRTVGVGAYLARLSERIIQRRDACILLTGFQSINKVLGKELYESNMQLGGPTVMANNGISHKIVDTVAEGVDYVKQLLSCKGDKMFPYVDDYRFCETMSEYAKNVVTGRGLINGKKYGIICASHGPGDKFVPCDPANLDSANRTEQLSPNVLYPDTSYKIAKTIRDCNVERVDLLIVADWRGFSGGTRDMFDTVLDFGSMIVSELVAYKQRVTIYVPPGGQLRGGSMVVFSKSINANKIRFYVSKTARINVLEPGATKELKYKRADRDKYGSLHGIADEKAMESIASAFVELNDRVDPNCRVLNKYEHIVDGIVEPSELIGLL